MGRLLVSSHCSPCEPLCARFEAEVELYPLKPFEASVAPFVGDVRKTCECRIDEEGSELF